MHFFTIIFSNEAATEVAASLNESSIDLRITQTIEDRSVSRIDRHVSTGNRPGPGDIVPNIPEADAGAIGLRLENPTFVSCRPRDGKCTCAGAERDIGRGRRRPAGDDA